MPRPLRLEFKDAWYHVMNRGAGKRDIFKTNNHRMKFLEIIAQAVKLFGVEMHDQSCKVVSIIDLTPLMHCCNAVIPCCNQCAATNELVFGIKAF